MHANVCDTVRIFDGFSQCNDRKSEEAEDFKCVFVVYCVRIEIDQLYCVNY